MCASTRFPEAVPLRNIKTKTIVKAIVKFFTFVGLPRSVQSDQGSNFMSGIFHQAMHELGINHTNHPLIILKVTVPSQGVGGTLIFSHIRRLGPFFGFKILNFNIFGDFQKNEYEYEDFVDIFLGSSQNWASLRVISMQFRVFC